MFESNCVGPRCVLLDEELQMVHRIQIQQTVWVALPTKLKQRRDWVSVRENRVRKRQNFRRWRRLGCCLQHKQGVVNCEPWLFEAIARCSSKEVFDHFPLKIERFLEDLDFSDIVYERNRFFSSVDFDSLTLRYPRVSKKFLSSKLQRSSTSPKSKPSRSPRKSRENLNHTNVVRNLVRSVDKNKTGIDQMKGGQNSKVNKKKAQKRPQSAKIWKSSTWEIYQFVQVFQSYFVKTLCTSELCDIW